MLKQDVFDHFQTASNVARALGIDVAQVSVAAVQANVARALNLSPAAVSKWGDVVPWFSAVDLERITGGELRVRADLYKRGRPISVATSLAANQ